MSARPDQIPTDLTLEIGGDLSPEQFITAARAFFGYVHELGQSVVHDTDVNRWIVRVKEGSALLAMEPNPSMPPEFAQMVYRRAEHGIVQLVNRDIGNAGLPDGALRHLKTLSEMGSANQKRQVPIKMRLWVERKPIGLEPAIANVINEEMRADYNDYGTIEGRLEAIQDTNGSLQFSIRDALLRQKVRCYFPEELLTEVFDRFRRRVEVFGVIHYRRNGAPISIVAERVVALPDDSDLPTAKDVRGILRN